ncbi:vacuolar protein sorting-associated protein 37A isoform X2 [Anthonomus grandis grandis]|uniref:vacuolar protein sorting-associated protein 37A isoform X2 n=1 Tax=Anthonomus grandis grandis TaxID=2921223 RepID=UPI00216563EA|nr:vacuolar protein sorting-associated protein 37A isoform X2 [Anthonomus grandis grandis]
MLPRVFKQDSDRKQQITTLKIFNDNVTEITEDSEYELTFQSGDHKLALRVTLGSDFPKEKPVLEITPPVFHPWVNEKGFVTSAPGLLNFSPHSDIGRVVQAIIRELQRNPPPLASECGSSNIDAEKISPSFSNYSFSSPTPKNTVNSRHYSSMFPNLEQLSLDELRFLDESEDQQDEFIDELPAIKEQNRFIDELIDSVEEENLSKEKHLIELKEHVNSQMEEVAKLAFENERLYSIYQNLSEKYSPKNIQEELSKAAKEADQESEQITESFLDGAIDVDKFLNLFIRSKTKYQLRKTKEEKLGQQLDRLQKAGF